MNVAQEKQGNSFSVAGKPVKSAPQRVSCVFTHLCSTLWNCSKSCLKQLWVEECGTERCCLRPRASAHLIIHRSKVTSDLSPCVFFLFHSRISVFFKQERRFSARSTSQHPDIFQQFAKFQKVYEHPDAVTVKVYIKGLRWTVFIGGSLDPLL